MDKLPDTIGKVLDQLSQRFGATGSYLWHVYVQYIFACSTAGAIGGLITIGLGILGVMYAKKLDDNGYSDIEITFVLSIIIIVTNQDYKFTSTKM